MRSTSKTLPFSLPATTAVPLIVAALAALAGAQSAYSHFESPQTNPIRLSADGTRLFLANTADSRLSIFDVSDPSLPILVQEVAVGLEPVSVNPRTADEVWVVNHVSDSVSVVSLSLGIVTDTIPVPDEPCDVVFAGAPVRAFVSAARSNAVKVFDVTTHALVQTIALLGEHPRALAVRADGARVYAAFALSGNRTTCVPRASAPPQGAPANPALPPAPQVGRIVDATDPAWSPSVIRHQVLDHDVVEIDAQSLAVVRYFDRTGTVNLGIAVRPGTGELWVANTDARNLVRFEPSLRGHVVDNRLTRVTVGATPVVTPFDLNPGLNYGLFPNPGALATALAQPAGIVFDPGGSHCWVAAFGTDRVAKVASDGTVAARVEIGPATGSTVNPRTKRGPRGLALNGAAQRLYVQNRISNTLSVVDAAAGVVLVEVPAGLHDPTPASIRDGRGFLYDAKLSGNGTVSCASCHVDGEEDHLAWDLGDPAGSMATVQDPSGSQVFNLHPMKGPMTTQTMKGLAGVGPYHWRGDRANLAAFNPAFDKLMGGSQIPAADQAAFDAFTNTILLQPNPNQLLDRTMPATLNGGSPSLGLAQFQQVPSPAGGPNSCSSCHSLPLNFVPRIRIQGPGQQPMKPPFMRSYYKKNHFSTQLNAQNVIGFGLEHDGTVMPALVPGGGFGHITAFFMSFDTGTAPAVGASRTVRAANAASPSLAADVATLESQAAAGNCDLAGKGLIGGAPRGLVFDPAIGRYRADAAGVGPWTWAELQNLALTSGAVFTLLGVPPGSGVRMGIDRDLDGILDGDETGPGFLAYGAGCAGSGGFMPALSGDGFPTGGAAFALRITQGLGGAWAILGAGAGNGALPLTPSCTVHIDPVIPASLTFVPLGGAGPGAGAFTLSGLLPAGTPPAVFHFQSLVFDAGAPNGFALTNALRAAIE